MSKKRAATGRIETPTDAQLEKWKRYGFDFDKAANEFTHLGGVYHLSMCEDGVMSMTRVRTREVGKIEHKVLPP